MTDTNADRLAQPGAARPKPAEILMLFATRWRMVPILVVLALVWLYFATQSDVFLSPRNLSNLAGQIVVTATIALGLFFVLVVAEIDLSVAAASAVSAGVMARLAISLGVDPWLAVLAGLGTGALLGLVSGLIVTLFRAPSFIVTLGLSLILQGVLLQLLPQTNLFSLVQTPIAALSTTYLGPGTGLLLAAVATAIVAALATGHYLGLRRSGLQARIVPQVLVPTVLVALASAAALLVFNAYKGVPLTVAILLALLGALAYLTTQTRFGLYLFAIGANPEAARRAGIPVNAVKVAAFVLSGLLVATGGIIAASRVMGVSPESADASILLDAIAAAVIGGVSLFGGRGSVFAALVGALMIGSVSNGLLLISATTETRLQVQGAILIIAVILDAWISRGSRRQ
jgi:D-xylose transport system permease protein